MTATLLCASCEVELPAAMFTPSQRQRGGYCQPCVRAYYRVWAATNLPPRQPRITCRATGCETRVRDRELCARHTCAEPGCYRARDGRKLLCWSHRRGIPPRPVSMTYGAVHVRIRKANGSARDQLCADCGARPGHSWSYDHSDPAELTGEHTPGVPVQYSADPMHYQPRCRPCHGTFDRMHLINRMVAAALAARP